MQPVSAIHTFNRPSLFAISFPSTHSISYLNLQMSLDYAYIFLITSFSAFSDLIDMKYWDCSHFRFSSALSLYCLPDFFAFPRYYYLLQWELRVLLSVSVLPSSTYLFAAGVEGFCDFI
jgi:hypothetical protein